MSRRDPGVDRVPRLLGYFELNRLLRLLLHDDCAGRNMTTLNHIVDAEPGAPAQLAVYSKVKQCEFAGSMIKL
jgi:hypothetical protein